MAVVAAHLRCVRLQPAQKDQSSATSASFASPGAGRSRNGPNEATPLVHDGVLFVHSYGDKVQALDAATGDLLWQYSRRLPTGVAPKRQTGHLDLRRPPVRPDLGRAHRRARRQDRKGRVGPGRRRSKDRLPDDRRDPGGARKGDGRDDGRAPRAATTSRRLTRKPARKPGDSIRSRGPTSPGGNSWNGLPLEKRNGGSVWIPGSYDPVQNLAFFAPGNTYDTGPLRDLGQRTGCHERCALYLDSTLALDPDTGKLAWYFQHQTNGQWDLDWAFERQVMQLPVNGDTQSVVVTAGKQMIFDIVEAETGKYVSSFDRPGAAERRHAIDPKTGAKIVDREPVPRRRADEDRLPARERRPGWMPTVVRSDDEDAVHPLVEACMDLVPVAPGRTREPVDGVRWTVRPRPESDGKYGRLQAHQSRDQKNGLGRASARPADFWCPRHRRRIGVCRVARPHVQRIRRRDRRADSGRRA